jgi:hypothetical protein
MKRKTLKKKKKKKIPLCTKMDIGITNPRCLTANINT